jgi:hypothetical protein
MSTIQISRATPSDVPALLPLVSDYWTFEGITGFEPQRITVELARLLSQRDLDVPAETRLVR